MAEEKSGCSCNCGGCLGALVIGTAIMGTIALGGFTSAWYKVKSIWDYDNQKQMSEKAFDRNRNGTLDADERKEMLKGLGIVSINGELPNVRIPYRTYIDFNKKFNQE